MAIETKECEWCGEAFARDTRGRVPLSDAGCKMYLCHQCRREHKYAIAREWGKVRYALLKEKGRCIRCIDRKAKPGRTMCRACLKLGAEANSKKYIAAKRPNS